MMNLTKKIPWKSSFKFLELQLKSFDTVRCISLTSKCDQTKIVPKYDYCTIETYPNVSVNEPSVVIVGAGIAGLSAAHRLFQKGFRNVTVLEATNRPGGRIHTKWFDQSLAELGSQNNPVFTSQSNLLVQPVPVERIEPLAGRFYTNNGKAIPPEVCDLAYHIFHGIQTEATGLFALSSLSHSKQDYEFSNNSFNSKNLFDLFQEKIIREAKKFPANEQADISTVMLGLMNLVQNRCGEDLKLVSPDQLGNFNSNIEVPLPMIQELPDNMIRYEKVVEHITWGVNGSRALVLCSDGEQIPADYVILTISLGCLKKYADKLFTPMLPQEKLNAIHRIGFGIVDKIFLKYDQKYWSWHHGIKLAWTEEDESWIRGINSIDQISDNMLCAWISGKYALAMECLSDEEVAAGVTKLLQRFTNEIIPLPKKLMRSQWGSDPRFLGSCSFMALDSTIEHQQDLAVPVPSSTESMPSILLFAGEATCIGNFGTVFGGSISGIREAERIIQYTEEYTRPPDKA